LFKRFLKRLARRAVVPFLYQERRPVLFNHHISAKLIPLEGEGDYYVLLNSAARDSGTSREVPVPPKEIWEGYGDTEEQYLNGGRRHVSEMLDILRKAGASPEAFTRVLDLGCAGGRMLRFYPNQSESSELWGVDVNAKSIAWCQQNLGLPFRFATTTTFPHLPFEDNYFDFVYAGSVFTHISDLGDAWLLECRRVLRKGGYAYITIADKTTVDIIFDEHEREGKWPYLVEAIRRLDNDTSVLSKEYASFSYVQYPYPYPFVFYDAALLAERWSRYSKVLSVTPRANDYQTAIVLQKH